MLDCLARLYPEIFRTIVFDATLSTSPMVLEFPYYGVSVTAYPRLLEDKRTVAVKLHSHGRNPALSGMNPGFYHIHEQLYSEYGYATVAVAQAFSSNMLPLLLCSSAIRWACIPFLIELSAGVPHKLGRVGDSHMFQKRRALKGMMLGNLNSVQLEWVMKSKKRRVSLIGM